MVKIRKTYSIDLQASIDFTEFVGQGNESRNIEEYMKFVVADFKKKNEESKAKPCFVAGLSNGGGTTVLDSESQTESQSQSKGLRLELLTMSRMQLNQVLAKIDDPQLLAKIRANAKMVSDVAKTRFLKLKTRSYG